MKSASRGGDTSKVEVSGISAHGVWLLLGDQELFLSFKHFPWFQDAPVRGVLHVELPQPDHLYWPDLDIDIAVESILNPEQFPLVSRERPDPVSQRPKAPERGKKRPSPPGESASRLITDRIAELGDWRGETLARIRALIKEADPEVVEEWKWENPVWSHDGIVCTGETYKSVVKLTFPKGASLKDPSRLFNSSLEGNVRRAIDIRESEKINAPALKALIRAAVALNVSGGKAPPRRSGER